MNLGEETIECLSKHGYGPEDVMAVGCGSFTFPVISFWAIADETDYDNGFGRQEIAEDLVIWMADGGAFVRHEYDGAEYWRLIPPMPQKVSYDVMRLASCDFGWTDLASINHIAEEAGHE